MATKEKPKKQRLPARRWIKHNDPQCCLACTKDFRVGDRGYDLGPMMIHEQCVELYVQQCKEIGIKP